MEFSTPLICCSSGVITVSAMVLGEAPGYCPLTTTVGGTISGYSLIGSCGIASSPPTVISIARTVANIGRSMKNEEIFIAYAASRSGMRAVRAHGHALRRHGNPGMHSLRAVHDDHITGFQSVAHDAQAVDHTAQSDLAIFDFVVRAEQQHIFLILVGVHGAIFDQDCRILAARQELHARKQAGRELPILVMQDRACADRAGLRIELIVDEIHGSGMRKSLLVGKADLNGIAGVA